MNPAGNDASAGPGATVSAVPGERGAAIVHESASLRSRSSGLLAALFIGSLAVASLYWYYAHALDRPAAARRKAQSQASARAQGEMTLPALGPVLAPVTVPAVASAVPAPGPPDLPLLEAQSPPSSSQALPAPGPQEPSPAQLRQQRELGGAVFARESPQAAPPAAGTGSPAARAPTAGSALGGLLEPTVAAAASAQRLPDPRFLLPRGAFLDCTLETAIDSTLPGLTTCITAADTFGADGKVVLMERGTKLVGETRGQLQQGQARLFVLWSEARTPGGVVVPLNSPGTDELGRAGLGGEVERHFWQRFGAAILISVIDGGVQAGVQAASSRSGAVIYAPGASQDVLTESLKESAQIPPTLTKANGERIQVLVARDVDFRTVYELHSAVP
ncbi:MAG: type IV secretion system protein VirB10 [Proteobacteria bacterium]|nr:type IV secretion system protein VirB10 [Pseudomonadota bacterium]